jgi:hypothetical protein
MSDILTSEVTQLLYRVAPQLNFAQVVSELHTALHEPNCPNPVLTWDCDDIAVLDFSAARVVIGHSENLPGEHAACLTIAVGQSPLRETATLAKPDQDSLCHTITERLQQRYPSDERQTQAIDEPLTPDLIDRVVDALFQPSVDAPAPAAVVALPEPKPEPTAIMPSIAEPSDMDRLMNRLSSELTARTPNIISRAIASASPKARATAAQDKADAALQAATGSPESSLVVTAKAKIASGLFWRKTPQVPQVSTESQVAPQSIKHQPQRTSSTELKAVREALYANDNARGFGGGLLSGSLVAAQTRQALQALATLPSGLASSIVGLRRSQNAQIGGRVRD